MVDETKNESGETQAGTGDSEPSIDDRLPPKFLADDPEFVDRGVHRSSDHKVLIPDGKGGVQSVRDNVVRIEHQGRIIELIALSKSDRKKRQRIINIVSIILGALFFALYFWLFF